MESLLVFFAVTILSVGIFEEAVVPATHKVIEVATPVVEKVIDLIIPETPEE